MFEDKRHVISTPKTISEKILDVLSFLLLLGMFLYVILIWGDLPDKVPAHFNGLGEPDRWGGKGTVLALPIVAAFLFKLLFIVKKFPQVFNYPVEITEENAKDMYQISRKMLSTLTFFLTFFFAIGVWETVQVAHGQAGLGIWFLPGLLVSMFGTIGYYMYRMFKVRKPQK
ncbi:DUF1648 domain-containing protein [Fredinandcohnia sp. 179-A 10B2 NHS]|uniref:DUF1648 domain-containing protein n=1 Tax=Fredinandcohnia sp. 179-A 10B2 NHS TaxID=3235176 RepID=UPI00399F7333